LLPVALIRVRLVKCIIPARLLIILPSSFNSRKLERQASSADQRDPKLFLIYSRETPSRLFFDTSRYVNPRRWSKLLKLDSRLLARNMTRIDEGMPDKYEILLFALLVSGLGAKLSFNSQVDLFQIRQEFFHARHAVNIFPTQVDRPQTLPVWLATVNICYDLDELVVRDAERAFREVSRVGVLGPGSYVSIIRSYRTIGGFALFVAVRIVCVDIDLLWGHHERTRIRPRMRWFGRRSVVDAWTSALSLACESFDSLKSPN